MLGQKVENQSLGNREWQLEEFSVMREKGPRHLLAGRTTTLREAVNNLEARSVSPKLIHFREQKVDGFQKNRTAADLTCSPLSEQVRV